jgi:hypothetical protein
MAESMLIFFTAKFSLLKLIPKTFAKPAKRTTAGAKLNRGGSDSFFASRILVFYDFLKAKN